MAIHDRDFVQSLERGLAVIEAFSDQRPAMTAGRIAEHTNLSRAACRRFLVTLERLGYVSRDAQGVYRLRPAVLRLGYAYLSSQELPWIVRPYLEEIARQHPVSTSLGVLDGLDTVFLFRVQLSGHLSTRLSVGSRLPATTTAMGRVLLAGMSDTELEAHLARADLRQWTRHTVTQRDAVRRRVMDARRVGYSVLDQEITPNVRALAVPIRWRSGRTAGSICVGFYDSRVPTAEMVERFLPLLHRAAERIDAALAPRDR
jgi:IclR family pca regulon transcriptional regulator